MKKFFITIKILLQRLLTLAGFRVERIIKPAQPIDVFELAVQKIALERGESFFFVQVGANDGIGNDPIRKFIERHHWRGLLVEPQPKVFERLKVNYSHENQLVLVNAAIARESGSSKLYTVSTDGIETGLASFDRRLLLNQLPVGTEIAELTVPAMTLHDLLTAYAVKSIDLLQIDAEGYDYEVIKMLDFGAVRPSVIHYEHRHLSNDDRIACERLLNGHGYRLHVSGIDTTAIIQS